MTHTIPLTPMPLLHHTRSVRRASGFVQTRFWNLVTVFGRVTLDLYREVPGVMKSGTRSEWTAGHFR